MPIEAVTHHLGASVNRNIGRAILAYILSLISPAIAPTIAQAQPGDTTKPEGDWVIESERPRAVAEAGERDVRSQGGGKAGSATQGEQDLDAATLWGRRPDGNEGRQSERASRGTSAGVDRVSKSEPIAASGAVSKDSGNGGRKSGGGSSGDKNSGDRDSGNGGDTGNGGDGGSGGTGGGGTGERGGGDSGASGSGASGSDTGGRSTGDRDQGSSGSGGSGGGGNSGGRDR